MRPLRPEEAAAACALARDGFERQLAAGQLPEGRQRFHRYAQPEALLERHRTRYSSWVAFADSTLVGLLHLHARNHLALLFIAPEHQGRGCALALLRTAALHGDLRPPLTVNSSPEAVAFYRHLGFSPDGPLQIRHGVRYQSLRLAELPPVLAR